MKTQIAQGKNIQTFYKVSLQKKMQNYHQKVNQIKLNSTQSKKLQKLRVAFKEKPQLRDNQIEPLVDEESNEYKFDWFKQWYLVGFDSQLDKEKIHSFDLMDQPIALWYDKINERWTAMLDICPHKLVPLSEGKITKDAKIQCGYHGWEFSSCGKCEKITFGDEGVKVGRRQSGTAYPTYMADDYIWVYMEPFGPNTEPMSKNEYEEKLQNWRNENKQDVKHFITEPGWTMAGAISRDLPYDYVTFYDNILDVSHVHYTHYRSLIKKKNIKIIDQQVMPENSRHMLAINNDRRDQNTSQINFRYPCMNHMVSHFKGGPVSVSMQATNMPMSPGKSRLNFTTHVRFNSNDWKFKLARKLMGLRPQWMGHVFGQNVVLDDDLYFLHKGERTFSKKLIDSGNWRTHLGQIYSMPTRADVAVNEFHKWLNKYAGGGPFGPKDEKWLQRAGPVQNFDDVYERYHSHTKQCKICTKALGQIKYGQKVLKNVITLSAVLSLLSASFAIIQSHFHIYYWTQKVTVENSQGILQYASAAVLQAFKKVLVGNSFQQTLAKSSVLAVISILCFLGYRKLKYWERYFYVGDHPYPRNQGD